MKIIITNDYEHMSQVCADIVSSLVKQKSTLSFCLPAGGSPIGMYQYLCDMAQKGFIDFSKMRVCNMDEYVGLGQNHPQSYNAFVRLHFLNHIDFDEENSAFLNGGADDLRKECLDYNQALTRLDLDLAISGIGDSGHIAFNEPHEFLIARTHVVDLHPKTVQANARFFKSEDEVPRQALSIGIADLFLSKTLIIVASGQHKAEVVSKIFKNDHVSTLFPVSLLKMHPNCIFILDHDAVQHCDFSSHSDLRFNIDDLRSK